MSAARVPAATAGPAGAVPAMPEPRSVDVAGVRTRYFEQGQGAPLVLIHGGEFGAGHSADEFRWNFGPLSESFHVYAFDNLGQGETDNPRRDEDYTISAMTAHAHAFMGAVGLADVRVIGHSRGALIGALLALDHPGLVRAFVLCDSASVAPGVPAATPFYAALARHHEPGTREYIRHRAEAVTRFPELVEDAWVEERYRIARLPKSAAARARNQALVATLFNPDLERVKARLLDGIRQGRFQVPTLLFWGYDDPSAPLVPMGLDTLHLLAAHNRRVSMHVVNHAGHLSFMNRADEFNRVVAAYLRGC
jgi:2-hydroxy-6-oxonona-2,4-dienedioate hydrolase